MKPGPLQRLDALVRHLVPLASTVGLMLVMIVPNRIPGAAAVMPMLVWMAVFYWAVFRPDLLRPWMAFLAGVMSDALSGLPMGVSAIALLILHAVASSQRRFFLGNTFVVAWWGFAMLAAGVSLLVAGLAFVVEGRHAPRDTLVLQYALTVLLYPPVAWTLARSQVALLRQR